MSKIIILVGLMGCGKTTFAEEYAEKFNYNYIDFDLEYHKKIQKYDEEGYSDHQLTKSDISEFLSNISELINNNPSKNYIIDGWFKWHINWWKYEEDDSLQALKKVLKFHDIEILHIFLPFKEVYRRYVEKHKKEVQEYYKDTMKERQKNLNRKIFKWATQ